MLVRDSLIAIFALLAGTVLVHGLKSPGPAAPPPAAKPEASPEIGSRVLFAAPSRNPVARHLEQGTTHVYYLPLNARELVKLIAYQDGVDLKVTVSDLDGKPFLTVNSPNGTTGPEQLVFIVDAAGTYRVEVSGSKEIDSGSYRIWIEAERTATKRDRQEAEAEILFFQAKTKTGATEKQLQRAASLWKLAGNSARQADALKALGQLYDGTPEWKKAIAQWLEAKRLYHRAGAATSEGKVDIAIGKAYQGHSLIEAAKKSYQQALANGERGGNGNVVSAALYSLGLILKIQGRAVEALEKLEQAKRAARGLDLRGEANALVARGRIFAEAGQPRQAMAEYEEAMRLLQHEGDSNAKAFAFIGRADLYFRLREQGQARRLYLEALRIQRAINDLRNMHLSLNGIALTLLNEGRPQEALEFFQKVLDLVRQEDNPLEQAVVLANLGWTYSLLNRENDSREVYERALKLARGRNAEVEAASLLGLTRLEEARKDPIAALRYAEAAVKCVEGMRAVIGHDLQISFLATKQDIYDALIEALFSEDQLHPSAGFDARALQVSEQARSRSLLDSVSSFRSKAVPGALPVPSILSLSDIQHAVLDSETLLLEYQLGESESLLWVIGRNSFHVLKLPPRQEIESQAKKTFQLLRASGHGEKMREARRAAENLSHILLEPAAPWLERKRLVISSPAVLQIIPFSVLPDPEISAGRDGVVGWPRPLFVRHEIVRIPSASVVAAIRARSIERTPPPNRLAILSDPVSSYNDGRLAGRRRLPSATRSESAIDSLYRRFDRLDNARKEAGAILSEAGSRGVWSANGFDATRELVLSGRLSGFRNIHFTMHGLFAEDDGANSALVLSLWDRHGRFQDGFLRASEISGLDLPADLVVLSACDTGRGESVPGEGVVGLPQAFLVAGATQVMMSLWPIDDSATAHLMQEFYHGYLSKGLSPAAALRRAEGVLSQNPVRNAPFYWGGFEIQGDWNPTSVHR